MVHEWDTWRANGIDVVPCYGEAALDSLSLSLFDAPGGGGAAPGGGWTEPCSFLGSVGRAARPSCAPCTITASVHTVSSSMSPPDHDHQLTVATGQGLFIMNSRLFCTYVTDYLCVAPVFLASSGASKAPVQPSRSCVGCFHCRGSWHAL